MWGKTVQINPTRSGANSTVNKYLLNDLPSRNHFSRSQSLSPFLQTGRNDQMSKGLLPFLCPLLCQLLFSSFVQGPHARRGTCAGRPHAAPTPWGLLGCITGLENLHPNGHTQIQPVSSWHVENMAAQPPIGKIWETEKTG